KKKLQRLRQERDNVKVKESIDMLVEKAKTDENLMPYILEAVKSYATLGEICGALREVFGEYEQSVIL
ncbi:methylmalonyl-CoA mutase family protein, partial [Vibrio parahaemolyticus]|nr:methylmalonyl-CoA mutase family protein [Vibrio parahaemolyticus]